MLVREETKRGKGDFEIMFDGTKKRGKASLPTQVDLMGEHIDQIIGGPTNRSYYSKKVVSFH